MPKGPNGNGFYILHSACSQARQNRRHRESVDFQMILAGVLGLFENQSDLNYPGEQLSDVDAALWS
jgi:hypothetical protein